QHWWRRASSPPHLSWTRFASASAPSRSPEIASRIAGGTSRFPQTPSTGPPRGQALGAPMWKHLGPVDVLDLSGLLDAIGSRKPAPGSGSAAALVGAMAAALCTKTARFSNDDGAVAQGRALERRLLQM